MEHTENPFHEANKLYKNSQWHAANEKYTNIFNSIDNGTINRVDISKNDLIEAYVNFADVLWACGVTEWENGRHDEAKKKWAKACDYWTYRLEGGLFGRKPLENEWDGSDLNGKTIKVLSERENGAFGDTFIMSFLLRYLKQNGATVVLVPQKPIKKIYEIDETLQKKYVDQVIIRSEKSPKYDSEIYLWSILKHYIPTKKQPFPVKPWLSGPNLNEKIKNLLKKHTEKLLIGFWYRSSGQISKAADYRSLDRDPGAHRMLGALQNIPGVVLINLEGMGHKPTNEKNYKQLKQKNKLGNLDPNDMTSYDTSSLIIMPNDFDKKNGAFVDTAAVMSYIKEQNGLLIGNDTGLLNMAAGIKKPKTYKESSVLAVLNEKADFRWGSDKTIQNNSSVKPKKWYITDDVEIYQSTKQGKWEVPLKQIREKVKERAQKHQEKFNK